jgi:hypothetical protein
MEKKSLLLEFDCKGLHYKGWATPSDKIRNDGTPASYSVVLNQVHFGDISLNNGKWVLDEHRSHDLIECVGECMHEVLQAGDRTWRNSSADL